MEGLFPYQMVVLWQPLPGTMIAVMIVAMLKVGHSAMQLVSSSFSVKPTFPLALILCSTGILRGSWRGSGWSLSQLVCTMNQVSSVSSQKACTASVSLSITPPSFPLAPDTTQYTGPPIFSALSLLMASAQVVCCSRVFLSSQTVGMALSTRMLMKSSQMWSSFLVSTLMAKAPCLIPVRAKTLPMTVSTLKTSCPPLQYSTLATKLEIRFHISKSRFLPCMIFPSEFLSTIPVQALKVENSQKKFMKNSLSKGCPLIWAMASTSLTKSWCSQTFLAYQSTPSKKAGGMGSMSKQLMNLSRGTLKSLIILSHLLRGESSRLTLQVMGAWVLMGVTLGTTVESARARRRLQIRIVFILLGVGFMNIN